MDDVVPVVLQRLREADIVGLAGLADASLGQEYARGGRVSTTKRQGARLSGVVTLPELLPAADMVLVEQPEDVAEVSETSPISHFEVVVEVVRHDSCQVVCTCGNTAALICPHAAALLYHWVNRSYAFVSLPVEEDDTSPVATSDVASVASNTARSIRKTPVPDVLAAPRYAPLPVRSIAVNSVSETVGQLGLSELRSVAREYDIALPGLSKPHLLETLIETLGQPAAVRRVVGALEKPQRQLLAAFALAGGVMSDEELRGLFERFALDNTGVLQDMLVALQAKLLFVRTSFQHSLQPRVHLNVSQLDLSWYIPLEVREALHVTLPVTPFDVTVPYGKGTSSTLPTLHLAEPYKLLADMLLSARALDGSPAELLEKRPQRGSGSLPSSRLAADGSLALPPPEDQPAPAMIEMVQAALPRSPAFLRFAVGLLRQANLLYKEDSWQTNLRVLPNAAQLLLGPAGNDILHELFTNWLRQVSYAELFELSVLGVRVRCRATPLNQPALRRGELEQENNEARQELLALLVQVPLGQWVNFASFARFVYRLHPTFLQRRQRLFPSPHWWVEQQEGRPLHPTQLPDWLRAEGRYLAYLIQGPLHWWGVCDLALSSDGQLLAFRLAPLASLLFQGIPPDMPEEEISAALPALTVSEAGDVLIPCQTVNWPLVACVEDFAESVGVQHEQLSYRLTPRSLGEALSRGHNPRDLLALLARFCTANETYSRQLLESLERRVAQYGRVRLYTDVSLLQTADASVMQQLHALTSLEEQTLRTLHPNLLLLKTQGVERLLEELKRRGQVPLLHEEG
ncbi:MAG: helicase-associated domain-containing protein [Ktedonobacteraceae bacterium]